jgi:hypothetical protein
MWFERFWLVTPTLGGQLAIGPAEIGMTAAFLSAFLLARKLGAHLIPESGTGSAGIPAGCSSGLPHSLAVGEVGHD